MQSSHFTDEVIEACGGNGLHKMVEELTRGRVDFLLKDRVTERDSLDHSPVITGPVGSQWLLPGLSPECRAPRTWTIVLLLSQVP